MAEVRQFGPADNRGFYQQWLKTDPLFDVLFISGVHSAPFDNGYDDMLVPTMSYLVWYGRASILSNGRPVDRTNVLVAVWADLMGPYISTDKIVDQDRSRAIFVEAVKRLTTPEVLVAIGDVTAASFAADHADNTAEEYNGFVTRPQNGTAIRLAIRILRHIARQAGMAFSIGGVSMIVHVYLAVLKRGTMSDAFTDKIITGITADLRIANFRIEIAACRIFYAMFGAKITDTTIRDITDHWSTLLPVEALRLRLTVQQAAGSGLTALSVTGRAIRTYTDFDWGRIAQLYPDEWANFQAAVIAVGNNVWYGFRHDLGPVASTKYKNVSYVAKELLIKVNGEASLRTYAGWTKRAKFQDVVDTLIANYETSKTRNIVDAVEMPEIPNQPNVEEMRRLLDNGPDVYV